MQISNELYKLLQDFSDSLNTFLKNSYIDETKLERFLHTLEKRRCEIYDNVSFFNTMHPDNKIDFIDNNYKAELREKSLFLYIPEKLPNLKNKSSYVNKRIILNIAEITKPYKKLFYDKHVLVVIKIYEKSKVWDVDNRTVKPIQDGLVYGEVIKDDNLFNCCYMVQGFYSDTPHIEVNIIKSDNIVNYTDLLCKNFPIAFSKVAKFL